MEEPKKLQVKLSKSFILELDDIYQYSFETFGIKQAEVYESAIWQLVESLSINYLLFPECRHLPTKSKMYRWIILESHLIVYRIAKNEVQVLRIIHAQRSISKIKTSRGIRL